MSEISTARPPHVRPFFRGVLSVAIVLLALYVVWNAGDYVEASRLDAAISDVRARGLYVDPPAHPSAFPEYADDVARFYMAAGDLIPANRVTQGMYYALRADKPMPPERIAEARAILAESEPAFALVLRAQTAPVRPWRLGYGRSLATVGKVSTMLAFRTRFLARTGETDQAAASLLDMFDVSRASAGLDDNNYLANGVGFFSSSAMWAKALVLEELLNSGRPSPTLLKRLERAFTVDPSNDMTRYRWVLQAMMEDLRFRRPLDAYLVTAIGGPPQDLVSAFEPILRPYLRHRLTQSIRDLTEVADVAREPWPGRLRRLEALAHEKPPIVIVKGWNGTVPGMFTGAMESTLDLAETVTMARAARVVVAVEEFRTSEGRTPAALSELVPAYLDAVPIDPFTGEPLRYRVDANAYTIYSVGVNGKDDGGNLGDWRPGIHSMHAPDSGLRIRLRPAGSD
jgi:hypothetical protein